MEKLSKEYFFLLVLLSMGAYGFFISLDLFTLFFFLEVAVIPKFLFDWYLGQWQKRKQRYEVGLNVNGGFSIGVCWPNGNLLQHAQL